MAALLLTLCILSSAFIAISIFLFIRFFSSSSSDDGFEEDVVSGGRSEIKYFFIYGIVTGQFLPELGKYAVHEYNLKLKKGDEGTLVFKKVVEAHDQVVSGMKYILKISAIQDGKRQLFDAVVHVNHNREKSLLRFDPSS